MAQLPTYKAGKKAAPVDGLTAFKLSSNENPMDPLPGIVSVIAHAATEIHRYPDPLVTELTHALAKRHNVQPELVATGTGSVGVCQQIVQAVAGAGDEVIFAWRSFEAYPIIATIAGATSVQVPLNADNGHDLKAMAAAITDSTRLIFVCTPNNPTGTTVSQREFDEFMTQVPQDILVVVDEAYVEFNRDELALDGLASMRKYPNVGVLRTFSKAYGLAALRIGFFIGPEVIADAVRKTAVPFGVSNVAQAAAVASLELESELMERVDAIVETREWFEAELRGIGFDLPNSQANFVWLALGEHTDSFAAECTAHAVAVRPFSGEGVRITIGEREPLDRVIEILKSFSR
jgi:histidinol-phosphate aminotransferase